MSDAALPIALQGLGLAAGVYSAIPVQQMLAAASYLSVGATAAQNTAALRQAISDAASRGSDLNFDGVYVSIDDELLIDTPIRMWASSPASCSIYQTAAVSGGKGVFRVTADNVSLENLTLTGSAVGVVLTGWTGDIQEVSAIKLMPGVTGFRLRNIKAKSWFVALFGFSFLLSAQSVEVDKIYDLEVDGLYVDDIFAAVLMSGLKHAKFRNVNGRYQYSSGHASSGGPPHLFYLYGSLAYSIYNYNVRLENCHAEGGKGGAPFSLRFTKGLSYDGLSANDCDGILDVIYSTDIVGGSYISLDDTYPIPNAPNGDRASVAFSQSSGFIGPGFVKAKAGNHGGTLFATECSDLTILEHRGTIDLATSPASGNRQGINVTGNGDVRIIRPEIISSGAQMEYGVLVASLAGGKVLIEDPSIKGAWGHGVRIASAGAKMTYDPSKIEYDSATSTRRRILVDTGLSAADAPALVNLKEVDPRLDVSVLGWHTGEAFDGSLSYRGRWPSGQLGSSINLNFTPVDERGTWLGSGSSAALMTANFASADIDLSAQVKWGATGGASRAIGFALRAIDLNNLIGVGLTATGTGDLIIVSRISGVDTTLASAGITTAADYYHDLRVTLVGLVITVWVDAVKVLTYTLTGTEATTFASQQVHGMWHRTASAGYIRGLRVRSV